MSDDNVQEFVLEGAENTNFIEVEDRSGDAYYDEKEEMPVGLLVLIIFLVGASAAGILFYALYRVERRRKEQLEAAKLNGLSGSASSAMQPTPTNGSSTNTHSSHATAADAEAATAAKRKSEIEAGLIVQTWMEEVHPSKDEQKEDEESQLTSGTNSDAESSTKNSCPICRKAYQTGDEVCSSRNRGCGHTFHKSCMSNWLQYQTRCPVCNKEYLAPNLS